MHPVPAGCESWVKGNVIVLAFHSERLVDDEDIVDVNGEPYRVICEALVANVQGERSSLTVLWLNDLPGWYVATFHNHMASALSGWVLTPQ
ncbi:MAG: hypothetical protein WBG57_06790 [Ornithinimicrobium sp.]